MQVKFKENVAISDSGFVFNSLTGDSYSINPIGAEIITMMKEDKSTEEIKQYILNTYDCDDSSFEKDYYDFVNQLLSYNLLEKETDEQD